MTAVLASLPSTTPEGLQDASVKFIPGTYRWADLYRWNTKITELFSSPQVVLIDIDERINRLVVGVDDLLVVEELTVRLDSLEDVPREAVRFERAEAAIPLRR